MSKGCERKSDGGQLALIAPSPLHDIFECVSLSWNFNLLTSHLRGFARISAGNGSKIEMADGHLSTAVLRPQDDDSRADFFSGSVLCKCDDDALLCFMSSLMVVSCPFLCVVVPLTKYIMHIKSLFFSFRVVRRTQGW